MKSSVVYPGQHVAETSHKHLYKTAQISAAATAKENSQFSHTNILNQPQQIVQNTGGGYE